MSDAEAQNVEPIELIDVLAGRSPAASRSALRKVLEAGRVRVNGKIVRVAKHLVRPNDNVVVMPRDKPQAVSLEWPVPVVHVDDDVLVIDKPAGLLTSTGPREKRPTAIALLREYALRALPGVPVGLIHRLDREASGLLVFSLSGRAHAALKAQFADRTAGRTYRAIVRGTPRPPRGTINASLAEHADGTVHYSTHKKYAQTAVTHYETLASRDGRTLLRVTLETGRKHQIRAHLAGNGLPIVGDTLYGGPPAERLMLAAIELSFKHPAGGRRTFKIDPPFEL